MYEYKLETHLKALCIESPQYINLYSTWILNKKTCSDALKTVVINYPHFSMHDASHAETVLSKIEMLLGDRVPKLSPADTWLLLHAAYTHDLGMVLKWDELENAWESKEFQGYLSSLSNSTDNELREAVAFLQNIKRQNNTLSWPLKTHRYVNLINAAYFRSLHAHISRKYIDMLGTDLGIDLGHNNLIQSRLLKLLGRICEVHTASFDEVLKLDYKTDGYGSDYVHPRFVAMLLRLGDLLDIDNGRFNTTVELVAGKLPETSAFHREKHNATTHILVTPESIQFTSDCPSTEAYLETRMFVTWLEDEVDFLTRRWSLIAPTDISGYAPCFDKKELLINGMPDIEGVAGLRFEVSQEKAFQIIEGSNIYEDRFVFIREVIQNAMDASKLQLWNDLIAGTYHAWIGDKDFAQLQPYDLDLKIYQSYPIEIRLSTLQDGMTKIEVTDRGTGISVDTFKRMCNVGTSTSSSVKLQDTIQNTPKWLRPTAGFGVGLQSIFLLTDHFEIDTSTGSEGFHAVVHSNRKGGYLQLRQSSRKQTRGTTIRIIFRMPDYFRFSMFGDTYEYLFLNRDPMSAEDHSGEVRVLESIKSNCMESVFPVLVDRADEAMAHIEMMDVFPICNTDIVNTWRIWNNKYRFRLEDDCSSIQLWDTFTASYGEFHLTMSGQSGVRICFKGMEVRKGTPSIRKSGITALVDVYGMDTKDTITLDRSSLTRYGSEHIRQIVIDMLDVYINCVLEQLNKEVGTETESVFNSSKFNIYTFWLLCSPEQRERIPVQTINRISENAIVITKNERGLYELTSKCINKLIPFQTETQFLNLSSFKKYNYVHMIDYERILSILNQTDDLGINEIIVDEALTDVSNEYSWKKIRTPVADQILFLYTVTSNDRDLFSSDGTTKKAILQGLGEYIRGMRYDGHTSADAMRYAIPALGEYITLAVISVPNGIAKPKEASNLFIISPFTRNEVEKKETMSKEGFIEMVVSSITFYRVVEYVLNHSPLKESISEDKVVAAYRDLIADYYDAK